MISLGLVLVRQALHRVVVDLFLGRQAVAHDVEPLAAHVERHAVGQVAAFGQAHAHDRVARLQQGEEHRLVGLRARVGLHVGVLGAEQLLHAVDRQLLDDVDVLAAAVVALAGVALGVLVGELACPAPPSRPARRSSRRRSARCALPGAGSRAGWRPRSRGRLSTRVDGRRSNMVAVLLARSSRARVVREGCPGERLTGDCGAQRPAALPGGVPPRGPQDGPHRQSRSAAV